MVNARKVVGNWVTTRMAADAVGRSLRTIYRYIHDGKIPVARYKGWVYVDLPAVKELVSGRKCPGCGESFKRVGRQLYCTPRCRQRHYARQRRAKEKAERELVAGNEEHNG